MYYIPRTYLFYDWKFVCDYLLIEFQEGRDFALGLDTLYTIMVVERERQIRKNLEPVFYNVIVSFHVN